MKTTNSLLLLLLGLLSVDTESKTTTLSLRGSDLLSSNDPEALLVLQQQRALFQDWQRRFAKTYQTAQEAAHRFAIWLDNHAYIQAHNNNNHHKAGQSSSFRLGHNEYSDLTAQEFQERFKVGSQAPTKVGTKHARPKQQQQQLQTSTTAVMMTEEGGADAVLPDQVDWVDILPPIKNQGMCGSCWAFSAIGAIEGAHYLDTGDLVALSEQQLVDCDKNDMGCGGGLMDNAFTFVEYNMTGICSQEDYPYAGHKHWFRGCMSEKGLCQPVPHTRVKSFTDVDNTEEALVKALTVQPVSIAIQADLQSFRFYKSGVYDDPECGNNLDHGVLAVGYGVHDESGKPYFKVRNSWGETWGDAGYVMMLRGDDAMAQHVNGTCGLLGWASRPSLREDGTTGNGGGGTPDQKVEN
mmetsp:Transcript_12918/g.26205  ORF Transcript_12918/g.26205 Transcript_12918/m.26205 type:complete len:409 (-) Transcript_12918:126-1352(-)